MMCNYINLDANNLSVSVSSKERAIQHEIIKESRDFDRLYQACCRHIRQAGGYVHFKQPRSVPLLCFDELLSNTKAFELPFPGYQSC